MMAAVWMVCTGCFSILLGGLLVVLTLDGGDVAARWFWPQVVGLSVLAVASVWTWRVLARRGSIRQLRITAVATALLGVFTLVLCNVAASVVIPAWPARGLHGVAPEAWAKAFSGVKRDGPDVGFNSFGQRDRARETRPARAGRVVLVGDSFLEEGGARPLNLAMEDHLGGKDLEVLNLGVSATAPDEYFYRTRNIALPLGATHVLMFIYAGNDFIEKRTLRSFMGITATYPRDSLLSVLGLQALAHVSMNWRRPLLGAWGSAGQELDAEHNLHADIVRSTPAQLVERFTSHVEESRRPALRGRLEQPAAQVFFDMLKNPDAGNFRSYFIWPALEAAAGLSPPPVTGEDFTLLWVQRTGALCKASGVRFTAVLVPEAFSVDDRMVEQYAAVADLREWTRPKSEALQRLGKAATAQGLDVVDLFDVLHGTRGSYLNMDGHWSQTGVDLVAKALVQRL